MVNPRLLYRGAAEAAKKSADAVVNAERAWIAVFLDRTNSSTGYSIVARNHGRTPAQVIICALGDKVIPINGIWVDPKASETVLPFFAAERLAGDDVWKQV